MEGTFDLGGDLRLAVFLIFGGTFDFGVSANDGIDYRLTFFRIMEGTFDYTVSPNNIHLESSFRVRKVDFESELRSIRESHPESLVWNRSMRSLSREWAAHNALHALGLFRTQTAHTDLNWPQPWLVRLGYTLLGTLAWPFIK